MDKAQEILEQIIKFKAFWNKLVDERARVMRQLSAATVSHLKESGQTHSSAKELEKRIENGQQVMHQKSLELHEFGYALIGNGDDIEPYDEYKAHTRHGVYGFITQHETIYEFAARNAAAAKARGK